MIISKENYNKLKQNDRIEYLLLEKKLLDDAPKLPSLNWLVFALATAIVLPLLWLAAFGSGSLQTPEGIKLGLAVGILIKLQLLLVIIAFIIYLFNLIKHKKNKRELIEKFFEIKTKK